MKTVLFVPGFGEGLQDRDYGAILAAIERKGYKTIFIPIRWHRTTIDDWVKQLNVAYRQHVAMDTILAGFSFGAMTALLAASERQPAELWLFSLSPYFAEDLPNLNPAWLRRLGKRRTESFSHVSFVRHSRGMQSKILLFIGGDEVEKEPAIKRRVYQAREMLPGSKFIVVQGAGHDVAAPTYIEAIKLAI